MNDRQSTILEITELIGRALALADEVEDTYLGVLLDTALHHISGDGIAGEV